MTSRDLTVSIERFALASAFTISRGSRTEAVVVSVRIRQGAVSGWGECVPYTRYGETVDDVAAAIEAMLDPIDAGMTRAELQAAMPAGAARNAVDCALWDLEAKLAGRRVWELAGLPEPQPLPTLYTISLDTPEAMAEKAQACGYTHLKIKLGGEGDAWRLAAIRKAVPQAVLVIDANEGWTPDNVEEYLALCAHHNVAVVEQPLPAGQDDLLARIRRPLPVCADESVHDRASLASLAGKYDMINIKLGKTGGLTEALALRAEAARLGLTTMTGCMVGTSLSMAPAVLVAQTSAIVDLDGPLLLKEDRPHGLRYDGATVYPPVASFWG